jgi:hypothetical protein
MTKRPRRRLQGGTVAIPLICAVTMALLCAGTAAAAPARARAPLTDSRRGEAALAQSLIPEGLATKTLQLLGEGVVFGAGGKAFGWVLQAFGGEEELKGQITEIRDQLKEIQGTLNETLAETTQIRSDLAEGTYSELVAQTVPITASIDKGMEDLDRVANMPAGDPTRKNFARATLKFIGEKLMGSEAGELAKRVGGEAGGDGLVVAASKVAKTASPYWTDRTTQQVSEVYDYYRQQEERLEVLRVEYMHANPDTYSVATIEASIQRTSDELRAQEKLLKPAPAQGIVADTHTGLLYDFQPIGVKGTIVEATGRDFFTDNLLPCDEGCWKMATYADLTKLIQGWPGGNWGVWLDEQTKGAIGPLHELGKGFAGAWTAAYCALGPHGEDPSAEFIYGLPCTGTYLSAAAVDERVGLGRNQEFLGIGGPDSFPVTERLGWVLVKPRTESYWW